METSRGEAELVRIEILSPPSSALTELRGQYVRDLQ